MTTLTMIALLAMLFAMAIGSTNGNGGSQGLAHALGVLRTGSPADKLKALELLAKLADMQVMPALVQALRDDDLGVRAAAQETMWAIWLQSGNDAIDTLMVEGIRLMDRQRYPEAVEVFSRMIDQLPTYPEAYNKRATVYYLMQEFELSIADIHQTIERNPVHFGALSGMGLCYLGLNEPRQALAWFERAVAINPNLDTIQHYIQQIQAYLRNQSF